MGQNLQSAATSITTQCVLTVVPVLTLRPILITCVHVQMDTTVGKVSENTCSSSFFEFVVSVFFCK